MKSKTTRNDFLENHILTNLKINQARTVVVFVVNKADLEKNGYDSHLWRMDVNGKNPKKLEISGNLNGFSWVDNSLYYCVMEGDSSAFYQYDNTTDTSKPIFTVPMKIGEFIFVGDKLFFCSQSSIIESTETIQQGTELPLYEEGIGVSSNHRRSLFSFSKVDHKITKITGNDISVTNLIADEAGSRIAFVSASIDQYINNESNLYLLDVESEAYEMILQKDSMSISNIAFIDQGTLVLAGADLKAYGRNQNPELYTFEILHKKLNRITDCFDKSISGKEVATDSRFSPSKDFHVFENQLFYITLERTSAVLYKIKKDGSFEKLSFETGTIDSVAITKSGVLFAGLRGNSFHELYMIRDGKETQLTNFNSWLGDNRFLSNPKPHCYINEDGLEIDGWVMKPLAYDESKKYAGILCIHGGPKMAYSSVHNHMMQLLAAEGYFVFYCNPRGSDGKGNQFADIRGNFATYAYQDIMGFVDSVLKSNKNIDANRLGVMGGSYGGYMTNYIIGQTSRFKAAVSERGISNLSSNFNTSDIGYLYMTNYMGGRTPWSDAEAYRRDSPLTYADQVKTPTLFIHGKIDGRCNYTESLQMFSAIKYFSGQSKICIFENESHMLEAKGRPLSKINRFDEILDWFGIHLGIEH